MNSGTSLALLGMLYGFVLWIITLVPIHKPITGFSPWNHPLGRMPALASLSGHIISTVLSLASSYLRLYQIMKECLKR